MEQAVAPRATAKRYWSDLGLALAVVLSVPLAMIVEYLSLVMAENSASWSELGVLGLFALPLVTAWVGIALSLASHALWLRLSVAVLLLFVPPAFLFIAWYA
jgi:hypothetical protein